MDIGFTELLVILVIIFVIFGAGKLPQVMSDMGRGIGKFKQGIKEGEKTDDKDQKKE